MKKNDPLFLSHPTMLSKIIVMHWPSYVVDFIWRPMHCHLRHCIENTTQKPSFYNALIDMCIWVYIKACAKIWEGFSCYVVMWPTSWYAVSRWQSQLLTKLTLCFKASKRDWDWLVRSRGRNGFFRNVLKRIVGWLKTELSTLNQEPV